MRFGFALSPYQAALIVSALVALLLGSRSWFGTRKEIAHSFALFQAAVFVWSLFKLVQTKVVSPIDELEAVKLQYLGIVFIPQFSYMIARGMDRKPIKGLGIALGLLPPCAFLLLMAGNEVHHWYWARADLASLPIHLSGGWGFWAFIAYSYSLIVLSFIRLARTARRERGMLGRLMKQAIVLFILPFAANVIFVAFFIGRTDLDPTPAVFALSGLLLARGSRHFDLTEAVPYAKNVILESIDTPFVVMDAEGLIVGANDEARRRLESPDLIEGRYLSELVPVLGVDCADGDTREWSDRGIDYLISCYEVNRARKRWRGRIFMFRDITALVKARRELEVARAKADAANAAKSAFVAVVSHELRNPLNAIIGLADLNLRTVLPPEIKDDFEVILSSGNLLLGLVNDLLDLSKIEAGKMELEKVDFDLHEKAVSTLRAFRPVVEKKGVFLDIVIGDGTPRYVRGDPLRYGQILLNLVSNAVKFTERGAVIVDISAADAAPENAGAEGGADPRSLRVLTTVTDSGIGIKSEQLPLLFREFTQADPSVSRRFGGTGLGLSISQRLAALFGGLIEVKSVPGQGSTFSFTARFEPGEESRLAAASGTRVEGGRILRVLVVDDDPINSAVARRYLGRLGHEAVLAGSGSGALELAGEGVFDLVLLDLGLPDMDGFEACRRIRLETAAGWAGSLPIAAMTARSETGLRGACLAAGMIDCLAKPLDPAALGRLLQGIAERAREFAPHAAASVHGAVIPDIGLVGAPGQAAPRPMAPGTPLIDLAVLLQRIEGDENFMRELLEIFVDESQARDEAFAAALGAHDLGALRRLGHALKGSALTLCAGPLGAAAAALQGFASMEGLGGEAEDSILSNVTREVEALRSLLSDTTSLARAILAGEKSGNGLPEAG